MSHIRARVLVASVWVVAFIVCFPPLIGWKKSSPRSHAETGNASSDSTFNMSDVRREVNSSNNAGYLNQNISSSRQSNTHDFFVANLHNYTISISTSDQSSCVVSGPSCVLNSEPGYIIYSALGSFWIPMWIMVFFYWRIYRAASKTTSAIRKGVLITKGSNLHSSSPENQVTLRVHRGGGPTSKMPHSPDGDGSHCKLSASTSGTSTDLDIRRKSSCTQHNGRYKRSHSAPHGSSTSRKGLFSHKKQNSKAVRITFTKPEPNFGQSNRILNERQPLRSGHASTSSEGHAPVFRNMHALHNGSKIDNIEESQLSVEDSVSDARSSTGFLNKVSRIQLKTHIKRINKEKKAAKTVGIIVGCFIVCWAPFFTVYLLGAFCPNCTPDILFTVFFWLGYCNSAVNPFLYAMCSKDFRYAFKKLLRCRVERRRVERTSTRFLNFINSIRIQISSKGSDSNSE